VKPSDTSSGQEWLENFGQGDLAAATVLLDSMRFVDLDTLRNGLIATLEGLLANGRVRDPSLLLPERNLGDLAADAGVSRKNAVAYETVQLGAGISVTPGSEGFIGATSPLRGTDPRRAPGSPRTRTSSICASGIVERSCW
jgi:hypothetical protein